MTPSKGKKILFESFEDHISTIVVGLFCLLYFGIMYLPEKSWIAKVLPFWPFAVFAGIAAVTFLGQITAWNLFKHFYTGWYRNPLFYILFICEFWLVLFTVFFLSWPLFFLYNFLVNPRPIL